MITQQRKSNKFSAAATFVVRKLWTLFAIALVLVALTMSLLRYSLPFLNDYKDHFEDFIASNYSIDLEIGRLSADWQNDGPAITLQQVTIKNTSQAPISLSVKEIFLEIDFWATVTSRKLQSNKVTLNQLDVAIDTTRIKRSSSDFPIIHALENVFLEQLSSFVVSNSRLTLISQENNQTIDITMLSWLNRENRHQGAGVFKLEDFSDNNASFILDLYGNVDSYNGTLFAQAQDVNLSPWINEFTGLRSKLVASKGNLEVWAKIQNSEFSRVDGAVLPTTFEWLVEQTPVKNSLQARFGAEKTDNIWQFSVVDLALETQGETLTTRIDGYFDETGEAAFQIANPLTLKPLFALSSLYSLALSDTLALTNMQASLTKFIAKVNKNGVTLLADLQDVGWQEYNDVAGIDNLQASIFWQGKRGKVLLEANQTQLNAKHYFDRNLPIQALSIPLMFDFSNTTNEVVLDDTEKTQANISIVNGSVNIDGLQLHIDSQFALANKFLSLMVNVDPFMLNQVPSLLPKHIMSDGLRRFLGDAFTGDGKVGYASTLWHGELERFPYADKSGIFQSKVSVENADFLFSKGWPQLTNLDMDVLFEDKSLTMKGSSGLLDKVALANLQATIPELTRNAILTIIADGAASSQDVTNLMLKSSLANSLGQLLNKDLNVDGDLTTQLALYVPLNNGAKTRAKGEVYLRNNKVSIPAINLEFINTKARVDFDNEAIMIKGADAKLLGQAVSIDITGDKQANAYSLAANMKGNWQASTLAQRINDNFADFFSGQTRWDFDLDLALMENDFTYSASLKSALNGIEANLPAPFSKSSAQTLPLKVFAQGDRVASSVDISLAKLAKFEGALAHKEKQFNRAHLTLGEPELQARGLGFSISGELEQLDVESWYPFVQSLTTGAYNGNKTSLLGAPNRIFIDTANLSIAGQSFVDANIVVKREALQWEVDVDSPNLKGKVRLLDEADTKVLDINADYIVITKKPQDDPTIADKKAPVKSLIEPRTLPRIQFSCQSCSVMDINLGTVAFAAKPNNDGVKISELAIKNDHGSVEASGQWYKKDQDHYTFIAGGVNSDDFGRFVSQLGFNAGIKDSSADVSFSFLWKDSPMDFAFTNLDGQIDWSLSDGSLTELSDQGSRIFTLLSLNSLVRKLSLDFRDVFAKGFFYNDMKGSVQIAQGIADTRDTFIDGAAGEIDIYGNTNLATQALNYNVSFTPNVTGNLPVLVYFFTVSPPTALAALALDQVLTSAKVISNINYSVTGSITEPVLVETGRQSTEVDLPARIEEISSDELAPFVPPSKNRDVDEQSTQNPTR